MERRTPLCGVHEAVCAAFGVRACMLLTVAFASCRVFWIAPPSCEHTTYVLTSGSFSRPGRGTQWTADSTSAFAGRRTLLHLMSDDTRRMQPASRAHVHLQATTRPTVRQLRTLLCELACIKRCHQAARVPGGHRTCRTVCTKLLDCSKSLTVNLVACQDAVGSHYSSTSQWPGLALAAAPGRSPAIQQSWEQAHYHVLQTARSNTATEKLLSRRRLRVRPTWHAPDSHPVHRQSLEAV